MPDLTIVIIIFIALFFDFTNGFHDAANSVATIVSTRILSPKQAVIWAAFLISLLFSYSEQLLQKQSEKG